MSTPRRDQDAYALRSTGMPEMNRGEARRHGVIVFTDRRAGSRWDIRTGTGARGTDEGRVVSIYAPGENLQDIVGFVHEATRRQVELAEQLASFHRSGNLAGATTVSAQLKRLICEIHSALHTLEDLSRQGRWVE